MTDERADSAASAAVRTTPCGPRKPARRYLRGHATVKAGRSLDRLRAEPALPGGRHRGAATLADGRRCARDVLFFAAPTTQGSGLARKLGCHFSERGSVKTRSYEKTNVPGLYVAGDASRHVELAIVAAAEGAMAAFAINSELLEDDCRSV